MIVLGIDPGSAICGYGFVEHLRGQLFPISYGVITTSPKARMHDRLLMIHTELDALIKKFQPQVMGLEKLFFGKNLTLQALYFILNMRRSSSAAQNNLRR